METISKIINILEKFFEKYFITTLISILFSFFIYLFTADNFWVLNKLGKESYLIVNGIGNFLIIELLKYFYKNIKIKISNKKYDLIKIKEENKEIIESYKELIDGFDINEKELLKIFINNDNSEIVIIDKAYDNMLLNNFCNSTKFILEKDMVVMNPYGLTEIELEKGAHAYKYKLKEDFYKDLKCMINSGEKLSNFDL